MSDDFSILRQAFGVPDQPPAEHEYCEKCDNGGWVEVYSTHPPAFEVCPACFNPSNNPSP